MPRAPQKVAAGKRRVRSPAEQRRMSGVRKKVAVAITAPVTAAATELMPAARRDSLVAWCELYMLVEGRASADATGRAKHDDLQHFLRYFLKAIGVDRLDLWTRSITSDYLKHLERELGRKPSSINRYLATLKHAARWIHSQRPFLAGNPVDDIADLEADEPEWRGLTRLQVTRVKAAADQLLYLQRRKDQSPYRNFAMFTVLLHTGLRISELLSLTSDQYADKHFANVKRKGNKRSRKVFLNKAARDALNEYLGRERGRASGPLFCSKTGRPLRRSNAHEVLALIKKQANANLADHERFIWSAHDLRHTFLREVANRYGVQYAKELSGHASDKYIWRYIAPSDDEKAQVIEDLY